MFKVPNQHRVKSGPFSSDDSYGNNGAFTFTHAGYTVLCIASDGEGWEHVSVSINRQRCPSWETMCVIKNMFWDSPHDCVFQFHPPESEYVNMHPYCLHLWRPENINIPTPPSWMIGVK